jgi:Domain of unknown function (DUF4868)
MANDVGKFMRDECRDTLIRLGEKQGRPYSGVPAIEEDEFLSLPLRADDAGRTGAGPLSDEMLDAAELVNLARDAFARTDFLSRDELKGGSWLFYAVVAKLRDSGDPIAFVKQYNPRRGFKTGRLVTAYRNTLSKFDDPIFNFDFDFDVIVAPDEIAILRMTAFERVFSDLDVLGAGVPDDISSLAADLGVEFSSTAADALTAACQQRATLARRLKRVARAAHLKNVTRRSLRDALARHGLSRDLFGRGQELEIPDDEHAGVLLDMLEDLYYEGDFSGEHRRADRYSPRP